MKFVLIFPVKNYTFYTRTESYHCHQETNIIKNTYKHYKGMVTLSMSITSNSERRGSVEVHTTAWHSAGRGSIPSSGHAGEVKDATQGVHVKPVVDSTF